MADDLSHLSDREHVRERPGMYIGDTTTRGLHHLVFEIIDNAISTSDGSAKNIWVSLNADGSVTIDADGPGISVAKHAELSEELGRDISTIEASMTSLKFDSGSRWRIDGGLHGVGPAVVNYLAEYCDVQTFRDGQVFRQSYRCGVPTGPVECMGDVARGGMRITFQPDRAIFQTTDFVYDKIKERVQELAFLCAGVRFTLNDERTGKDDVFCWEQGPVDYVKRLNQNRRPVHPDVIHLRGESKVLHYEIAFQYCVGCQEDFHSFANLVRSHGFYMDYAAAGTHVSGFRRGLTHSIEEYGKEQGAFVDVVPTDHDFYYGLTGVVSVRIPNAKWEGSMRSLLANVEAREVIARDLSSFLREYFAKNSISADAILHKILHSARLRHKNPPIDSGLFAQQERQLTKPDEDPNGWGTTACFPASYKIRMIRRNGGELRTLTDVWRLFPIRDESSEESLKRTKQHVVQQTKLAYSRPGFPKDALAVGENHDGDLLVFLRRRDPVCGANYPNTYADELYRWDHRSGELHKIAEGFEELCWAPDTAEDSYCE